MADAQTLPPPPRLSGDYKADFAKISSYLYDAYNVSRLGSETPIVPGNLPDPSATTLAQAQQTANIAYAVAIIAGQSADEAMTAAVLAATAATAAQTAANAAQTTANSALTLAGQADTNAATAQSTATSAAATAATASTNATNAVNTANAVAANFAMFGTVTLSDASTSAVISFSPAQPDVAYNIVLTPSDFTGTPAAGSRTPTKQTNATGSCTIDFEAAPGVGNSITFNWHLRR